jgi:two-component system sensor kinase FixL
LPATGADLDEIGDILNDIVADDRRAGKVIHRLRSLFKKGECKKVSVDINDLIREVVSLIHTEAMIRNVSIETTLARGLSFDSGRQDPAAAGDYQFRPECL